MLTPNGKFRGVMFWQLLQSLTGVGIIAPWNSLSGQGLLGFDKIAAEQDDSPLGGDGIYSDWAVTELGHIVYCLGLVPVVLREVCERADIMNLQLLIVILLITAPVF